MPCGMAGEDRLRKSMSLRTENADPLRLQQSASTSIYPVHRSMPPTQGTVSTPFITRTSQLKTEKPEARSGAPARYSPGCR